MKRDNMNDEFPVGFLGFNSDFEFSESCFLCRFFSGCAGAFYTWKKFCFFSAAELRACTFFLVIFSKYVLLCNCKCQ